MWFRQPSARARIIIAQRLDRWRGLGIRNHQNWIFGLEYDYAAFGTRAYQLGTNFGVYSFDVKPRDIQSAVARVSYKFNGPLVGNTDRSEASADRTSTNKSPGIVRAFC